MLSMVKRIVLINDANIQTGIAEEKLIHTERTPLHRGFSLFLFNARHDVLITKRSLTAISFPGLWSNTLKGHQGLGESALASAKIGLVEVLGIPLESVYEIVEISPYRFQFVDHNGIMENEICTIVVAKGETDPKPDRRFVTDYKWVNWYKFAGLIEARPREYAPWCKEEAKILMSLGY